MVGNSVGSNGHYWLSAGSLSVLEEEVIGNWGTGTLTQTGGVNFAATTLYLGRYFESNGTYQLSGTGELSADEQYVGCAEGTGVFTQDGGTNHVGTMLYVGHGLFANGTYDLNDGDLTANHETIGNYEGTGTFTQNGGSNTITGSLFVGYDPGSSGTYELRGDGQLSATREYIGYEGSGTFTQSGGMNTVQNTLYIRSETTDQSAVYNLSGGTLSTGSIEIDAEAGTAAFNLSDAGHLSAEAIYVGVNGHGEFTIGSATAEAVVADRIHFGSDSTLLCAPGATVRMAGASFENENDSAAALAGLSELTLIFEGGEVVDLFEVAGNDLGAVAAGFVGNFALDTLQLGNTDAGHIQLIDAFDNSLTSASPEALYVERLILLAGAFIDFNDLNLYYLNGGTPKQLFLGDANLDGQVDTIDVSILAANWGQHTTWAAGDFDGSGIVDQLDAAILAANWGAATALYGESTATTVPEPSCCVLLFGCSGAFVLRCRRRLVCS